MARSRAPKPIPVELLPPRVQIKRIVYFYPDKNPLYDDVLSGTPKNAHIGQIASVLRGVQFSAGDYKLLVTAKLGGDWWAWVTPGDFIEGAEFLSVMADSRRRKKNPAKLERCVRAVKRRNRRRGAKKARKPYAVCTAALAKRRRNPGWHIAIQAHPRGPVLRFTGTAFSNRKPALSFISKAAAVSRARALLRSHRKLRAYRVWVAESSARARTATTPAARARVNPSQREKLDKAAQKLEDFTGHEATHVERARSRSDERTGLVIGELDLIGYRAARQGIAGGRLVRYSHKFRKNSRPLLAVSTDGKQLHVVGGQYEFTDAGIEDRG
jgi:hypothetical protein